MKKHLIPLGVFMVLVGFLGVGLGLNPREVPSPLVNRPTPAFSLPTLAEPQRLVTPADMKGQVWLLNVWASWCVACQEEHPVLVDLAKAGVVPIYGLNYKDKRPEALAWLARHGDPYTQSFSDPDGLAGLDLGVYGVPETFVIDRAGVIRHKHIGPVTVADLRDTLLPLIGKLGADNQL
ncbi:MAG: DsbE family thiol:disulfide interchange protein [Serpentinimonas sp.]|jgi:cytochrome c biogenesis protein CcmG/thiol:disulfide interchange protein DsbE|nr:DsbE family thiol:disulfide interchange protein [Serpentinimonas sp.]